MYQPPPFGSHHPLGLEIQTLCDYLDFGDESQPFQGDNLLILLNAAFDHIANFHQIWIWATVRSHLTEQALELCRHFKLDYLIKRIESSSDKYKTWKLDGCSGLPDEVMGFFTGCGGRMGMLLTI